MATPEKIGGKLNQSVKQSISWHIQVVNVQESSPSKLNSKIFLNKTFKI